MTVGFRSDLDCPPDSSPVRCSWRNPAGGMVRGDGEPETSTACQSRVDVTAHMEAVRLSLDSQMGPVFPGDGEGI